MPGGARAKCWAWTLNNYTPEDEARFAGDHVDVEYLVYGRETAPDTGTPHLQGFVKFVRKLSLAQAKAYLGQRVHLEVARNPAAAIQYCKKDGSVFEKGELATSRAGRRTDIDSFKDAVKLGEVKTIKEIRELHSDLYSRCQRFCIEYLADHAPGRILPEHALLPWQQELKDRIDGEADDRTIEFIVDLVGNNGKTWFSHWYQQNNDGKVQVMQPGKKADMAFCLDNTVRVLFLDAPRSKQGEFVQYDFLEDVKNGFVFSTKYESRVKKFEKNCHVVVMMNEMPDMTKLSQDRYKITELHS